MDERKSAGRRLGYKGGRRQTSTTIQTAEHAPVFALKPPERIREIACKQYFSNTEGMTMKQKIIRILQECMIAAQQARERYAQIEGNADLSPEGMERQLQAVRDELSASMTAGITEIKRLLTEKIEEIDREEAKAFAEKNSDLAFQQRIIAKANILKDIDLAKIPTAALEAYLEEFKNYPFAAEYFRTYCHSGRMESDMALNMIMRDNTGERQKTIKHFMNNVEAALTESARTTRGDSSTEAFLRNRIAYIEAQSEDFSLDDSTVAEKMGDAVYENAMNFGFTRVL